MRKKGSGRLSALVLAVLGLAATLSSCHWLPGTGDSSGTDGKEKPNPVYYSAFGAKGDGETDDFDAIIRTHEYANRQNRPVAADEGAVYYIGAHRQTAVIRTDTNWGDAEFIIDDREVSKEDRGYNVFQVASDGEARAVEIPAGYSLRKGQKNVGLDLKVPALLRIVNDNKKDYIRYGNNQNGGSSRQEIVLVDEDGRVDEDTPVLWDYDQVTSVTAYPVSDKAVTVEGGRFITVVNRETVNAGYYARGIDVRRSNTTLSCISHYLEGEPKAEENPPATPTPGNSCAPYTGFYSINNANNVTVESCVLTGHAAYRYQKPTGWVTQGTYDTQATRSNRVSWIDCTQSNSITDKTYWGVMSSNFCKNLTMEGGKLSRFDAHQGVYNATVRDSELGQTFNVIGAGTLLAENVVRSSGDYFVQLRTDYGSTWEGEAVFKNCTLKTTSSSCYVLSAVWADWNFGYPCFLPEKITVDGFKVENPSAKCYLFSSVTSQTYDQVQNSNNPYSITRTVCVLNEATPLSLSVNRSGLFDGVNVQRG